MAQPFGLFIVLPASGLPLAIMTFVPFSHFSPQSRIGASTGPSACPFFVRQ